MRQLSAALRVGVLASILAASALGGAGCDVTGIEGNGTKISQTRSVGPFTEIEVRGAIQLNATVGSDQTVSISADENLQEHVATTVEGTKLIIHPRTTLRPRGPLVATVHVPKLDAIALHSAAQAMVTGLEGGALHVGAFGATTVSLTGQVDSLTVEMGGAARLAAQTLKASTVRVQATGAAQAEVAAQRELSAELTGASRVMFTGNPTIDKKVSEAAAITRGRASGNPAGQPFPPGAFPGGAAPGQEASVEEAE